MTSFDLPNNFNSNPERIGRIVIRRIVPPQKRLTWPISSPSTSASSPMAQKTLRQFSARPVATFLLDWTKNKPAIMALSWKLDWWTCRGVERLPRMPMPISRTFWRWVTPSTPKELRWISSGFGYSRSHCSGKPRCGFTPTRKLSRHGKPVQMHSWPNTVTP